MSNEEKERILNAKDTVRRFNSQFPVGSAVRLRKIKGSEDALFTVAKSARIHNYRAVAKFEGLTGMYSVDDDFVKYKY